MDWAAKQNWKRMLTKIVSKFLESYKTRENAFHKTHERLFFGKFLVSFRTTFGKFEYQQKSLGKWFWTNFVKIIFRKIVGNFLVNSQNIFVFASRFPRAVPWNTKSSFFYARAMQPRSVLQNLELSISRYGPYIWLINSNLLLQKLYWTIK